MTAEELITFGKVLVALFAALGTIGGGVAIIAKIVAPFKQLDERLTRVESYCKRDDDRIRHNEEFNKVLCKALFAILDHELTGNSVDKLSKAKSALQDYIIEEG